MDEINALVQPAFPGSPNSCAEVGDGYAVARRVITADELRPGGYISGPTQFAVADAALWYLVFAVIERVELMALTSELSIRYLRPAVGETLWARATLDKAGSPQRGRHRPDVDRRPHAQSDGDRPGHLRAAGLIEQLDVLVRQQG